MGINSVALKTWNKVGLQSIAIGQNGGLAYMGKGTTMLTRLDPCCPVNMAK